MFVSNLYGLESSEWTKSIQDVSYGKYDVVFTLDSRTELTVGRVDYETSPDLASNQVSLGKLLRAGLLPTVMTCMEEQTEKGMNLETATLECLRLFIKQQVKETQEEVQEEQ